MSDYYEPTSHEYLYEMDRENLFALFVGAVDAYRGRKDPNFRHIGFYGLPVRDTLELEMEL